MRRRDFFLLVGAAAAGPPTLANGQQLPRLRRIGVLLGVSEAFPEGKKWLVTFVHGLAERGWSQDRNVQVDVRWSGGDADRIKTYAADLVGLNPDVILVGGTVGLAAVQKETHRIPVVAVQVIDLVSSGFAQSLARPGGNVTGFINFESSIGGKWLLTMKEVVPDLEQIAVMMNPANRAHGELTTGIQSAAQSLHMSVALLPVQSQDEISRGIDEIANRRSGLIVLPDTVTISNLQFIIDRSAAQKIPALYPYKEHVAAGGLMSYGPDQIEMYRRAASYSDRILRGDKAADLPVQAPTKFQLVINLKTAKALGLDVPISVLSRTDEVIE
jgi:putative ABC transport system substrate-binding protein